MPTNPSDKKVSSNSPLCPPLTTQTVIRVTSILGSNPRRESVSLIILERGNGTRRHDGRRMRCKMGVGS